MRQITLKVQAGKVEEIAVDGDYVRVKSAGVPVRIEAESGQVDATIEQGDALNLKPFKRLRVSHSDAAEQTITLMIGNGTSADSAKVGGQVSVSGDVSTVVKSSVIYGKNTAVIGTVGSSVRGIPPTPRRYIFLQNLGTTDIFLMFGANAELNKGYKLVPDASLTFDTWCPNDMLYAISSAAGGLLSIVEGL